jgi:hypothetical protein
MGAPDEIRDEIKLLVWTAEGLNDDTGGLAEAGVAVDPADDPERARYEAEQALRVLRRQGWGGLVDGEMLKVNGVTGLTMTAVEESELIEDAERVGLAPEVLEDAGLDTYDPSDRRVDRMLALEDRGAYDQEGRVP